jgi:hypothetical protein
LYGPERQSTFVAALVILSAKGEIFVLCVVIQNTEMLNWQ